MSDSRDLSHAQMALVAHELRGALTIIAGYTALLRHPLAQVERSAALDGIERAISRADALCDEALAGRAPRPRSARDFHPVDVRELAEQAAEDLRSLTGRTVSVSGDDGAVVSGDEQALARVLGNLVTNAAKYSPPDSPIDVTVSRQPGAFHSDRVVIEVADRGLGIPAEQREAVFEPFHRLPRDEATPGTGLGLAVVREVTQAHDGTALARQREGGGTVVRIDLPAK